jgi:uroporphyrinogen-III synthase
MPDNVTARPLATLLLTRPRAASERFAAEIGKRGLPLEVVIAPLMEIVQADPPEVARGASFIFTSANAIPAAGPGLGRRAWCVGERTTAEAGLAGFEAIWAGATADELVHRLLAEGPAVPLMHLHGHHQRGEVAERLCEGGLTVTSHVVYDQVECPPDDTFFAALRRSPLWVPLFSPRSAALFVAAASDTWAPRPEDLVLAFSTAVAATIPSDWAESTAICSSPTGAEMLDEVARRISPSGDFGGMTRY